MGLWLDGLGGQTAPVQFVVGAGECRRLGVPDPEGLLRVLADSRGATGRLLLDDDDLLPLSLPDRVVAGLGVATGRVADLPGLRVVDVCLLGRCSTSLRRALRGGEATEVARADDVADARALGGRLGLGPFLDSESVGLPAGAVVRADVVRALLPGPAALVWRDPEWLDDDERADVVDAVRAEASWRGVATVVLGTEAHGR